MSPADRDPRVYFAAERTLLAWLRTGIAVMAFGFVVARFGLFLRLLRAQGGSSPAPGLSTYLGAALVGLGVAATVGGAIQYIRFCRTLRPDERPAQYTSTVVVALAWALAAIGLLLAITLVH